MIDGPIAIVNRMPEKMALAVHEFRGAVIGDPEALTATIRDVLPVLREASDQTPSPGFDFSRRLYRLFSVDPTKYRPSSEALMRRLRKDGDFPFVNPPVDLTNWLSLEFQVPYGLYDIARLTGEIEADRGKEGEAYTGIRKDEIRLAGKPMLRDAEGAFGNPSSDSSRARAGEETRDLLQVIFFHPEDPRRRDIAGESLRRFLTFFRCASHRSFDC